MEASILLRGIARLPIPPHHQHEALYSLCRPPVGAVAAVPTATTDSPIVKRASINDVGTGYASQNGGTSGGAGGTTTVSSFAQFTAAIAGTAKKVVVVSGPITQASKQIKIGSNTSIIGKDSKAVLTGFGLIVKEESNVIIRNIAISKVLAANGDAIGVQLANNVWIDHVDLSSDRNHDKDYYDGLIDFTLAADFVTISNSYIHDHWKASLIGHSDSNGAEDTGHLRATQNNNHKYNINARAPTIRFGTGHIFNSYFSQSLWRATSSSKHLYSTDAGYAVANDDDFGSGSNTTLAGTLKTVPYSYSELGSTKVKAAIEGKVGNNLSF
ncbi:hypothetical protein GMDG_05636 [Pseudogymnoascus destructans 20631-21]|uniref:Pectate lyase domain-containing protein n=1 Tax=Pseudogymnoascus destructans (strain ATCC MYA-4855 / 20631-21) TaxID=658429 RepID=L8FP73_PSED2|nr:hypothetical protein GMDG_05636 [Pseudogymnoascus destructans 20631-21]